MILRGFNEKSKDAEKKNRDGRSANRNTKRGGVEKAKRTEEVRGAKPRKWATSKGMRKNKEKKARNRTVALREHQTNLGTSKKNGRLKESTPRGGVLARRGGIDGPFVIRSAGHPTRSDPTMSHEQDKAMVGILSNRSFRRPTGLAQSDIFFFCYSRPCSHSIPSSSRLSYRTVF